jgi:hypothetical protein
MAWTRQDLPGKLRRNAPSCSPAPAAACTQVIEILPFRDWHGSCKALTAEFDLPRRPNMTAAAEKIWDMPVTDSVPTPTPTPSRPALRAPRKPVAPPAEYVEIARQVADQLSDIALDTTRREEIAEQIHMLEHQLKKRAERLAAMEDAILAQRTVEARRARRRAGFGSRLALVGSGMLAAMFTGMVIVSVL